MFLLVTSVSTAQLEPDEDSGGGGKLRKTKMV